MCPERKRSGSSGPNRRERRATSRSASQVGSSSPRHIPLRLPRGGRVHASAELAQASAEPDESPTAPPTWGPSLPRPSSHIPTARPTCRVHANAELDHASAESDESAAAPPTWGPSRPKCRAAASREPHRRCASYVGPNSTRPSSHILRPTPRGGRVHASAELDHASAEPGESPAAASHVGPSPRKRRATCHTKVRVDPSAEPHPAARPTWEPSLPCPSSHRARRAISQLRLPRGGRVDPSAEPHPAAPPTWGRVDPSAEPHPAARPPRRGRDRRSGRATSRCASHVGPSRPGCRATSRCASHVGAESTRVPLQRSPEVTRLCSSELTHAAVPDRERDLRKASLRSVAIRDTTVTARHSDALAPDRLVV
jgi:hypothetical protein